MSIERSRAKLHLQIVKDPCSHLGKQRARVFVESGGSIGRSLDCFWVLPDPNCHVSGHHCEVLFRDEAYWIRDTSRNGVFLNGAKEPLGLGQKRQLQDGDRLNLGAYRLYVSIQELGAHAHEGSGDSIESPEDVLESSPSETSGPDTSQSIATGGEHPAAPSYKSTSTPDWAASTQFLDPQAVRSESNRIVKIDRAGLQAAGLLSPPEQERMIANQFRKIKRPVIANAMGNGGIAAVPNGRLIMVTSALPGEGKTFGSMNLALSLARERDLEVLLVDADVAKPNISNVLGIQDEPGLLNALVDNALEIEALVLRTDVDRLSVLPAGRCELDTATELLASSRMEKIASQIAARHPRRMVILDSSPLLLTNESQVLATSVGQVVLVVKAGSTPQPAVMEAIGLIAADKPVGLILNQSRGGGQGSYYGYGAYGYGYGYGVYKDSGQSPAE